MLRSKASGQDQIEVGVHQAKLSRHDPDDLARLRIHHDVASDHGRVAAEMLLPVGVAEHHGLCTVRILIHPREPAASGGRNIQCLEYPVADKDRAGLFRLGEAGDIGSPRNPDAEGLKGAVLLGVGEIHRRRQAKAIGEVCQSGCAGSRQRNPHKFLSSRIGQRFDQHAVEHAEDCRIGTDSYRQCEDYSRRESRRLCQSQECEPHIGPQVLQARPLPRFAAALCSQCDVAEFAAGLLGGFFLGHAVRDQLFRAFVEMFLDGHREIVIATVA